MKASFSRDKSVLNIDDDISNNILRKKFRIHEIVPDCKATRDILFCLSNSQNFSKKKKYETDKIFALWNRLLTDERMVEVYYKLSEFEEFDYAFFFGRILTMRNDFTEWVVKQKQTKKVNLIEIDRTFNAINKVIRLHLSGQYPQMFSIEVLNNLKDPALKALWDISLKYSKNLQNSKNQELLSQEISEISKMKFNLLLSQTLISVSRLFATLDGSVEYPVDKYPVEVWRFKHQFNGESSEVLFALRAVSYIFQICTGSKRLELTAKIVEVIFNKKPNSIKKNTVTRATQYRVTKKK